MTLSLTADELAGIVDIFELLTRDELETALDELAFKKGVSADPSIIDASLESYHLVAYDEHEENHEEYLLVGPTAFPVIPDRATDLPHIMDVETREIDRYRLIQSVEQRYRAETARALNNGEDDRLGELLDLSYDLEAWGALDLSRLRDRLDRSVDADFPSAPCSVPSQP